MKKVITGTDLQEMIRIAYENLAENRQDINDLNVFPVPDGDTGTNMTMTVSSAVCELEENETERADQVVEKVAAAMLRGARGNSGVILSMMFRGIAKGVKGKETLNAVDLADAMGEGVAFAYKAVSKPVEGTILTVGKRACQAADKAIESSDDVDKMMDAAVDAADKALSETTAQNPVLARAGVVDAGGLGLLCILEAFRDHLRDRRKTERKWRQTISDPGSPAQSKQNDNFGRFGSEEITFTYEIVYTMTKLQPAKCLEPLRAHLDSLGDSLVISESDGCFKVHIHTDVPGEVLTVSDGYGVLQDATVENLRAQYEALVNGNPDAIRANADQTHEKASVRKPSVPKKIGYVSVCNGEGITALFEELGCDQIVNGGQTMNPSAAEILEAIDRTPAETVFVFPNNSNIVMTAEQCNELTDKRVIVVPTETVPEGVICMLNAEPDADSEELYGRFCDVMDSVHSVYIAHAVRDSMFDGRMIHKGEFLGIMDGELFGSCASEDGISEMLKGAVEPLNPGFVSIYYGEDVCEEEARLLTEELSNAYPDAEMSLISGGQSVYCYMISIESGESAL